MRPHVLTVMLVALIAISGAVQSEQKIQGSVPVLKVTPLIKLTSEAIGSSISSSKVNLPGIDYDRYLGPDSVVPDPLKRALQTYKDVETLPSCNKMAASALLHSCAALDNADTSDFMKDADFSLDQAKSIFATRFAVCEISEAKAAVPQECATFIPTQQNSRKKGFMGRFTSQGAGKPTVNYPVYESSTEHYLDGCRAALESRPQWWTSYSNSRQNAVSLCHAVRGAVEKDENLHLYKVLAETTVDLTEALRQVKSDAAQATEAFHDLTSNARNFHVSLYNDDQARQAEIGRLWDDWMGRMNQGVDHLADRIKEINSNLQDSEVQITTNRQHAIDSIETIAARVTNLLVEHSKAMAAVSQDASTAHERVQYHTELLHQGVIQNLYSITGSLETSNTLALALQRSTEQSHSNAVASAQLGVTIGTQLQAMSESVRGLRDDAEEMRGSINSTRIVVSELRVEVEATKSAMAAITGFFTSLADIFGRVPAIAWYFFWVATTAAVLGLIYKCPGGGTLLCIASNSLMASLRWVIQHITEVLTLIVFMMIFAIESPLQTVRRWQTSGISTFEKVAAGAWVGVFLAMWAIIFLDHYFGMTDRDDNEDDTATRLPTKEMAEHGSLVFASKKQQSKLFNAFSWFQSPTKRDGEIAL